MKIIYTIILLIAVITSTHAAYFFPISFWTAPEEITDERFAEMAEANFTLASVYTTEDQLKVLDLCQKHGLKAMVHSNGIMDRSADDEGFAEFLDGLIAKYSSHPALWGYHIFDEPLSDRFRKIADITEYLRKHDPKHIAFTNLLPIHDKKIEALEKYDGHVQEFMRMVQPEILSFDHYALFNDGTEGPYYFYNLEVIRQNSIKYKTPFNSIILAIPHGNYRDPSDADLRWQIYSSLAYGAKAICYFTYAVPLRDKMFEWGPSLLDKDNNRDPKYYMAQKINAEILKMAPVLLNCDSVGVYNTGDLPMGTKPIPYDNLITSIGGGKFVLGQFMSKKGELYAMIVNRDPHNNAVAKINFAQNVKVSEVLRRGKSGKTISTTKWQKELNAGDGVLIKIDVSGNLKSKWHNEI